MAEKNTSRFRALTLFTIGSLGFAGLLAGCADVITSSHDSHRQGMKFYDQGEYGEAAGAFRNSVRQNPREYESYFYLGASYEKLGQYQQAIQAYRQGLASQTVSLAGQEDDAFRAKLTDALAHAIAKSDQRDIETNSAVQLANSRQLPADWFLLAKVYAYRGDADSAIDAYNRACLLDPKNFIYQKEYGLYLEKVGQPGKAVSPLRRAYGLNGKDEEVATALRRLGVVPGPSLKDRDALVKPPVPKGPIPELQLGGTNTSPAAPSGSAQAPRD